MGSNPKDTRGVINLLGSQIHILRMGFAGALKNINTWKNNFKPVFHPGKTGFTPLIPLNFEFEFWSLNFEFLRISDFKIWEFQISKSENFQISKSEIFRFHFLSQKKLEGWFRPERPKTIPRGSIRVKNVFLGQTLKIWVFNQDGLENTEGGP